MVREVAVHADGLPCVVDVRTIEHGHGLLGVELRAEERVVVRFDRSSEGALSLWLV